jgi:hypothetical protein
MRSSRDGNSQQLPTAVLELDRESIPKCTDVSSRQKRSLAPNYLLRFRQRVRIWHPRRDRGVSCAHGAHIAGGEAGYATARGQTEFRGAIAAADRSPLRTRGEQLPFGVAGDAHCHPGHVVGYIEGLLGLAGLHGAVGGTLRLRFRGMDIEPATICGGVPGVLLQLELDRVGGLGRRYRTRGRRGWSRLLLVVACCQKQQRSGCEED